MRLWVLVSCKSLGSPSCLVFAAAINNPLSFYQATRFSKSYQGLNYLHHFCSNGQTVVEISQFLKNCQEIRGKECVALEAFPLVSQLKPAGLPFWKAP